MVSIPIWLWFFNTFFIKTNALNIETNLLKYFDHQQKLLINRDLLKVEIQ